MRVSPQLHGELHWSKEAAASSKATCPPTRMPPHYRPGIGKRHTWWMTQKVRQSSAAVDLNPCALNWKKWRRWLAVTPWLLICASDLRGGMSDGQRVLLHRQISTDPHGTCIGKMITVETWLKGLKSGFSFGLETENYGLHLVSTKTVPRRSRKSPNTVTPSKALQIWMDVFDCNHCHHASIWLWRCMGDRQSATRLGEASLINVNGTCGQHGEFFDNFDSIEATRPSPITKRGNWKAPLTRASTASKIQQITFLARCSHHTSIWLWRCVGDRQSATRLGEASLVHVNGTCSRDAEFFRNSSEFSNY